MDKTYPRVITLQNKGVQGAKPDCHVLVETAEEERTVLDFAEHGVAPQGRIWLAMANVAESDFNSDSAGDLVTLKDYPGAVS